MERKKYLILMAGGSGTRMGAPIPKQFLELGGRAILHATLERFCSAIPDIKVVTVLPEAHIPFWRHYCAERNVLVPQVLVTGGITRFHSVRNGLGKVPEGAVVAIHDGVRPLVSEDLIRTMFDMAREMPAVIPVIPSIDTVRALENKTMPDGSSELSPIPGVYPDRNILFRVQTPQVFRSEDIRAAYTQAYSQSFTDDASVAEKYGIPLSFVQGERMNIKITSREDLILAQAILEVLQRSHS